MVCMICRAASTPGSGVWAARYTARRRSATG